MRPSDPDLDEVADPAPQRRTRRLTTAVIIVVAVALAGFWAWALFFASKEAVNRIDDREWAARAEAICRTADARRDELIDLRELDGTDAAMLAERADLVDRATDIVAAMLDEVVAVAPTDEKGRAIVPQWEADYRTYLDDRREYADLLRTGADEPFRETASDAIPLSDKVATFAGDNEMPTCSPPTDLS